MPSEKPQIHESQGSRSRIWALPVVLALLLLVLCNEVLNNGGKGLAIDDTIGMTTLVQQEPTNRWHQKRSCVTAAEFYDGKWEYMPDKPRPELLYFTGDSASDAEREFRPNHPGDATVHLPYNQWEWVPKDEGCPMVDWEVGLFCGLLAAMNVTSIMVVGDSVSFLQVQSLYHLAQGTGGSPEQMATAHWEGLMCQDKATLYYVRDDALHPGPDYDPYVDFPDATAEEQRGIDIVRPWTPLVTERKIDMLILNAGAHIHDLVFYKRAVNATVDWLRHNYHGQVMFRTILPAHPDCDGFDKPLESESELRSFTEQEIKEFTWDLFPIQNEYATALFQQSGAQVLYGNLLLSLRADGHRGKGDCIHYHLPGPPDWLNKMMFNEWLAVYGHLLPEEAPT